MRQFTPDLSNASVAVEPLEPFGVLVRAHDQDLSLDAMPVEPLREQVREHHLLLLRGFRPFTTPEQLTTFAEKWGEVMTWPFGAVLDLVEQENPTDGVFGSNWLPYHWDGMFVERIPEFQVFQCMSAPDRDQGGRTTFCDTTKVLADASPQTRQAWEATTIVYGIDKVVHYGGTVRSPLVVPHPDRGFPTMRYQEPVPADMNYPNRPTLRYEGVPADGVREFERQLREALYDPGHCYAHGWRTGDFVVTDNYTLLHGREGYTTRCNRHLRRVHVLGDPPLDNPALQ